MFLEIPLGRALSTISARSMVVHVNIIVIIDIVITITVMTGGAHSTRQAGAGGATGAYGGEGGEEGGTDLTFKIYESNKYQLKYISSSTQSFFS